MPVKVNQQLRTKMKMGDDVVMALRSRARANPDTFSPSVEAEELGVTRAAVSRAVGGSTYSHLPGAVEAKKAGRAGPTQLKKFLAYHTTVKLRWPHKKCCVVMGGISTATLKSWRNLYHEADWEGHARQIVNHKPDLAKRLRLSFYLMKHEKVQSGVDIFS